MKIREYLSIIFAAVVFLCCFTTVMQLGFFLSSQKALSYNELVLLPGNSVWCRLGFNAILILIFIVQHHFQAAHSENKYHADYKSFSVVAERLIYNAATCFTLQVLMRCWQPTPTYPLWIVNTSQNGILWWTYTILHVLAWFYIYGGCLVMDMSELIGVKQVYYSVRGWKSPLTNKSENLRRLYGHMRHPSFTAITIILFVHPVMLLDRLILAVALTLFMYFAFMVDESDYLYQKKQFYQKVTSFHSLSVS